MIYKNKYVITPTKSVKLTFNKFFQPFVNKDENLLDGNEGVICYNFSTVDGSLQNGYGLRDLTVNNYDGDPYVVKSDNNEVTGIWTQRWLVNANSEPQDYLFYLLSDGTMNYIELSDPEYPYTMENTFTTNPSVTKIRQSTDEAFALTSSSGLVVLNQISETIYSSVPNIMDACYQYNKMFAITSETRNALVYSSQLNVTSWTSSNTYRIDFTDNRGRLIKIMSFNDELYVFRDFGITKITPYSVSFDFSIDHIYETTSCIYPETIANCGDKVVFMTRDGMFSFNGSSVKKLDFDILKKVDLSTSANPCGIFFDGKYFLACKTSFDSQEIGCESSSFVNNTVIIFDIQRNEIEIMSGVDIKQFAVLSSTKFNRLLAIFRGSNKHKIAEFVDGGKIFGQNLTAMWKSGLSDLGYTVKLKHVKEIKLISNGASEVIIQSETGSKSYQVSGLQSVQRIKTDVKGTLLSFGFKSSSSNQKISKPEISMTVYM